MSQFLGGALWVSSTVAGLVFLRYWKISRDRLFLYFCAAFWVMALQWLLMAIVQPPGEERHYFFLMRLTAFLLILAGIVDKNRRASRP